MAKTWTVLSLSRGTDTDEEQPRDGLCRSWRMASLFPAVDGFCPQGKKSFLFTFPLPCLFGIISLYFFCRFVSSSFILWLRVGRHGAVPSVNVSVRATITRCRLEPGLSVVRKSWIVESLLPGDVSSPSCHATSTDCRRFRLFVTNQPPHRTQNGLTFTNRHYGAVPPV